MRVYVSPVLECWNEKQISAKLMRATLRTTEYTEHPPRLFYYNAYFARSDEISRTRRNRSGASTGVTSTSMKTGKPVEY